MMDDETNEKLRRCVDPKVRAEGYARWLAEHAQIPISEYPAPGKFYEVQAGDSVSFAAPVSASQAPDPVDACYEAKPTSPEPQRVYAIGAQVIYAGGRVAHLVKEMHVDHGYTTYTIVASDDRRAITCVPEDLKPWPSGEAEDLYVGQSVAIGGHKTAVVVSLSLTDDPNPWARCNALLAVDGTDGVLVWSDQELMYTDADLRFEGGDCVMVVGPLSEMWGRTGFVELANEASDLILVRFRGAEHGQWDLHSLRPGDLVVVRDEYVARTVPQPSADRYVAERLMGVVQRGWEAFSEGMEMQRAALRTPHTYPDCVTLSETPSLRLAREDVSVVVCDPPYSIGTRACYCAAERPEPKAKFRERFRQTRARILAGGS